MKTDLLQFSDYRAYLRQEFAARGENRGRRARLAASLGCQTSFVSQVLTERAHLSLEHAYRTSEFLQHTAEERRYFLLLVQQDRAGSRELKRHFADELESFRKRRSEIQERIGVRTELTAQDQMKYYSAWHYCAIHVLTAFDGFRTAEAIAARLRLEVPVVKRALQFLSERGFVTRGPGGFTMGRTRIHLPKGSEMLPRHHANWRQRAIAGVDHERATDLHYTAVLGISRKDTKLLRERLLALLQEFEPVIRDSKVEEPVVLLLDLFGM